MKRRIFRKVRVFSKRFFISILIFLIIFVAGGYLYLFNPFIQTAQAAWFNENWAFRKAIPIATHTASESNVYITFQLDTATLISGSKLQSACQDIRVTDINGNLLSYHVGRTNACNNSATTIDALVSTMPAGSQTYYVYYGNSSATSQDAGAFSQSICGNSCTTNPTLASEEKSPAPIVFLKFDESYGTTANDSSTNTNSGTLGGSTLPAWETGDLCISGDCLYFDGSSSKVTGSKVAKNIQTISFWIRPNTIATQGLVNLDGGTHTINSDSSGVITANGFTSPSYYLNGVKVTTLTLVQNAWNHVEITTGTGFDSTSSFTIGTDGSHFIKGFIDNVKFYNGARSAAQVLQDYNSGINNTASIVGTSASLGGNPLQSLSQGLVSYWKMDEGSWSGISNEVTDSSGNGNNGTSTGISSTSSGSNSSTTLNDTSQTWTTNAFTSDSIYISSGTGSGQNRAISSNTATQVTISVAWSVTPDATSHYRIIPRTVAGKFGFGGYFDGVNGYDDIPSSTNFNVAVGGAITISMWIKPTSCPGTNSTKYLFSRNNGSSNMSVALFGSSPCAVVEWFNGSDGSGVTDAGTSLVTPGSWTHIVVTYDSAAGKISNYQDGALVVSYTIGSCGSCITALTTNINQAVDEYIGSNSTANNGYNGDIDEVRVYNRALTASEITNLYNFAPGPFNYYNFDEGTGTTVNDRSTNAENGTWQGTLTSQWANGKFGKAGLFNGSDNRIFVNSFTPATVQGDTIEGWINQSSNTGSQNIYYASATMGLNINNGTIRVFQGNSLFSGGVSSTTINTGVWTHIAAVYDGVSLWTIYKNGVKDSTVSESLTGQGGITGNFGIGSGSDDSGSTWSGFFSGYIDDFKIYNYPRTEQQVIEDMNAGHPTGGSPVGSEVGYWKFDEGSTTTAHDSSISNNSGTLTNMASPATSTSGWTQAGRYGRALNFDGSNDYVAMGSDVTALKITGAVTLSAWINLTSFSSQRDITCKWTGTASTSSYCMFIDTSGKLNFEYSSGGTPANTTVTGTKALSTGTWYHVVAIYNPSNNVYLYINGILDRKNSTTATALTDSSTILDIGAENGGTNPFSGSIDEVKIYAGALTPVQVQVDYNQGQSQVLGTISDNSSYQKRAENQEYCVPGDSTSCAAPVADWRMNENTGQTAHDTSGNGFDGSLGTNSSVETVDPTWAPGKYGSGLSFNPNSSQIVTVAHNATLNPATITIEAWLYIGSTSQTGNFISKNDNSGYRCRVSNNNVQFFDRGATNNIITGALLPLNGWAHVACIGTASGLKIYVNGVLQASNSTAYGGAASSGSLLLGGTSGLGEYYNGKMDEVKIFNYERSAAQIAWDYNKGAPLAWWKLNECQGTTANDSSGDGNTGTITIGATGSQSQAGTCADGLSTSAWNNGAAGKYGASLNLDGTNDYVALSNPTDMQITGAITLSAWINLSSLGGTNGILTKSASSPNAGIDFFVNSSNNLQSVISNDGTTLKIVTSNATLAANTWYQVAIVYVPSTSMTLYINGLQDQQITSSIPASINNNSINWDIGARNDNNRFFSGKIDDVRLYNYALTATQIKNVYNEGDSVQFVPLTGP